MKANMSLLISLLISVLFFIIGLAILLQDPMSYMNFNYSGTPEGLSALANGHIRAHQWIGGILFATGSFGIITGLQKFQK